MPRGRKAVNPNPEGSAEYTEWEVEQEATRELRRLEREAAPVTTDRRVTVTVSIEAINAAKALGTLSGLPYREVLGNAAAQGVDALVAQVQAKLLPAE
jgi:predicted DNA binding CopG/RHH family protein